MKIRTRLTIYFTLLVLVLIVIRSLITYESIYQFNDKEFYDRLHAKALTTAFRLLKVEHMDSAFLKIIDRSQYDLLDEENITVYDSTDHEIYTNNDSIFYKTSPELFNEIRAKGEIRYMEGAHKILAFYYADKNNKVVITAGAIDKGGDSLLKSVRLILITTLIGSILTMSIMGWFFVGQALKPMLAIINRVKNLSPVEKSERLPEVSENDEIAALVGTFNDLFDKLEDSFRLQKNFVANVSHELNNPLTKIKSQLEVGLMQKRDSEAYRYAMESILEDVNELIVLIQDLMNFSRLSTGQAVAEGPIRIDELLFEVRDNILAHFPHYSINISLENLPQSDHALIFSGNKPLMTTALKNIVENACKFSVNKSALLKLTVSGQSALLSVTDKGPGIAESDLPHIFELFYRSSSMETVKGYGIGLALAQRILKAHNLHIAVQSKPGVGTTFAISFERRNAFD